MIEIRILIDGNNIITFNATSENDISSIQSVSLIYNKPENNDCYRYLNKILENSLVINNINDVEFSEKFNIIKDSLINNKLISIIILNADNSINKTISNIKSIFYKLNNINNRNNETIYFSESKLIPLGVERRLML